MRLQHGFTGGVPIVTLINRGSKLRHTPSFRASMGQVPVEGLGVGVGGGGGGGHRGGGLVVGGGGGGGGGGGAHCALAKAKKRRLSKKNKASDALLLLEPISLKPLRKKITKLSRLLMVEISNF
ncbi:hypothetical protein LOK49_LG11G02397 [Camellia lanceoleosa]|uniref:Uncharacterized protein n=1 Tax=Camellia lanceoleosa TaxID=1840588 RepID=A0ACC0FZG9_9ERIC|nr:hypothetical protein LOK49_LG11G02397 [Camellia lanceoleosa]